MERASGPGRTSARPPGFAPTVPRRPRRSCSAPVTADPGELGLWLHVVVDRELRDRGLRTASRIHSGDLPNRREEPLVPEAVICLARLPKIRDGPLAIHLARPVEDQALGRVVRNVHLGANR